jgi:hypothetical protein
MTRDEYRAVCDRHPVAGWNSVYKAKDHPLDCLTVAEWVAEARAGWPRVGKAPSPKVAAERGARIAAKHEGVTYEQLPS